MYRQKSLDIIVGDFNIYWLQSTKIVTFISRIYANGQITNTYYRINIRPYTCEGRLFGRSYHRSFSVEEIFFWSWYCAVYNLKKMLILPYYKLKCVYSIVLAYISNQNQTFHSLNPNGVLRHVRFLVIFVFTEIDHMLWLTSGVEAIFWSVVQCWSLTS